MLSKRLNKKGRFLSLILRHNPEKIGIKLDDGGWASTTSISQALDITLDEIKIIVASNNKKRFALSECLSKIRASQGHSIPVDLGLVSQTPPEVLYHGTVPVSITGIMHQGIDKMTRNHVHLSQDIETATQVAKRRGKPVILHIRAKDMHDDGIPFYLSENNVWLTDSVPPLYIMRVDRGTGE